jgi:competence transcription factor ComK
MLVSVECYNDGLLGGSFYVVVEFTGATLSKQTTQPYVQLNNSTAKFPLSLHSLEHQTIDTYFNVNSNVKSFNVKVTFESNQLFIRSAETNPFNRNTMDYFLNQSGNSYVIGALPA